MCIFCTRAFCGTSFQLGHYTFKIPVVLLNHRNTTMTFEDILRQIIGGASRTVDTVGRATRNVLPEFNLSERGETYGAGAIAPADRVTRVQNDPRFGTNLQSSAN